MQTVPTYSRNQEAKSALLINHLKRGFLGEIMQTPRTKKLWLHWNDHRRARNFLWGHNLAFSRVNRMHSFQMIINKYKVHLFFHKNRIEYHVKTSLTSEIYPKSRKIPSDQKKSRPNDSVLCARWQVNISSRPLLTINRLVAPGAPRINARNITIFV